DPDQHPRGRRAATDHARLQGLCGGGRADVLRSKLPGSVSAFRRLCRQDSARDETGRPSGPAADQIRSDCEPDHGEGAWPQHSVDVTRSRRRGDRVKRRDFITLLGAAAAWPLAARAQQAMPVIGFLRVTSAYDSTHLVAAFQQGLKQTGFVDGQNVAMEYRWADGQEDRLPELAADLVRRRVAVIVGHSTAAQAAKTASSTTPIIFVVGNDPIRTGLVANLNRPGSNVTGVTFTTVDVTSKRLGQLHELVPGAELIGVLVNSNLPEHDVELRDAEAAARTLGLRVLSVKAGRPNDFHSAFGTMAQARV